MKSPTLIKHWPVCLSADELHRITVLIDRVNPYGKDKLRQKCNHALSEIEARNLKILESAKEKDRAGD